MRLSEIMSMISIEHDKWLVNNLPFVEEEKVDLSIQYNLMITNIYNGIACKLSEIQQLQKDWRAWKPIEEKF